MAPGERYRAAGCDAQNSDQTTIDTRAASDQTTIDTRAATPGDPSPQACLNDPKQSCMM